MIKLKKKTIQEFCFLQSDQPQMSHLAERRMQNWFQFYNQFVEKYQRVHTIAISRQSEEGFDGQTEVVFCSLSDFNFFWKSGVINVTNGVTSSSWLCIMFIVTPPKRQGCFRYIFRRCWLVLRKNSCAPVLQNHALWNELLLSQTVEHSWWTLLLYVPSTYRTVWSQNMTSITK